MSSKTKEIEKMVDKVSKVALLANPIRLKILLALYISEVKELMRK